MSSRRPTTAPASGRPPDEACRLRAVLNAGLKAPAAVGDPTAATMGHLQLRDAAGSDPSRRSMHTAGNANSSAVLETEDIARLILEYLMKQRNTDVNIKIYGPNAIARSEQTNFLNSNRNEGVDTDDVKDRLDENRFLVRFDLESVVIQDWIVIIKRNIARLKNNMADLVDDAYTTMQVSEGHQLLKPNLLNIFEVDPALTGDRKGIQFELVGGALSLKEKTKMGTHSPEQFFVTCLAESLRKHLITDGDFSTKTPTDTYAPMFTYFASEPHVVSNDIVDMDDDLHLEYDDLVQSMAKQTGSSPKDFVRLDENGLEIFKDVDANRLLVLPHSKTSFQMSLDPMRLLARASPEVRSALLTLLNK